MSCSRPRANLRVNFPVAALATFLFPIIPPQTYATELRYGRPRGIIPRKRRSFSGKTGPPLFHGLFSTLFFGRGDAKRHGAWQSARPTAFVRRPFRHQHRRFRNFLSRAGKSRGKEFARSF